jgi:phosphatidylglycerophosphatase A
MKRLLVVLCGSFFYTGFAIIAPASCASLVFLLIYLLLPGGGWLAGPVTLAVTTPLAVYLSWEMERYYGEDASCIVIDEVVGMQVSLFMVEPSVTTGIIAFVSFRIFDIVKPFPAGASQRLRGGFGVVMDDLIAGLYARILLYALMNLFGIG